MIVDVALDLQRGARERGVSRRRQTAG